MQLTKFVSLAIALALLAGLTGLAGAAEPEGGWALATSKQKSTGRIIVFRYLNEFPAGFSRKAYPDRVILVWRYKSDMGLPQTEQRQRMEQMEDLLNAKLEAGDLARLVLVSTGEDFREWIFYARSEDEFMARLNSALADQPAFPIEVHTAPDPGWSTYDAFRKNVRQ